MAINGEIRKKETNFELMNVGVKKEPILKVVKRKLVNSISDLPDTVTGSLPNDYHSYIQRILDENLDSPDVGNMTELVKQYLSLNEYNGDWK
jgi:hypothetical protein